MKIALINGSPKRKNSASGFIISLFKRLAGEEYECAEVKLNRPELTDDAVSALSECDCWIVFYPLYVDGVPSHLVACLKELEGRRESFGEKRIYAVSNCGFHDGRQCEWSLDIVSHWSRRMGFEFCGGIGLGGGGAVPEVQNIPICGMITSTYSKALRFLHEKVKCGGSFENYYRSINMPRWLFKLAAERGWGKSLVKNGRKKKDISNIPQ